MATSVIDGAALASAEGGKGKGKLRPPPPPKAKAKPKAEGYAPPQAAAGCPCDPENQGSWRGSVQ